jgi:hypothetical protein
MTNHIFFFRNKIWRFLLLSYLNFPPVQVLLELIQHARAAGVDATDRCMKGESSDAMLNSDVCAIYLDNG